MPDIFGEIPARRGVRALSAVGERCLFHSRNAGSYQAFEIHITGEDSGSRLPRQMVQVLPAVHMSGFSVSTTDALIEPSMIETVMLGLHDRE